MRSYGDPVPSSILRIEERVDSVLRLMTLKEKIGQLCQYSGSGEEVQAGRLTPDKLRLIEQGQVGSMLNVFGSKLVHQVQERALRKSRLKIPLLLGQDVIHGFKTIFPIPLGEASTWDPELVRRAAEVSAKEATAVGLHWTFAPMVDIARDARWGRIAEGSGEDPLLGARMAEAKVRGFQGIDLASPSTLAACVKHFAAYGAAEGGRDYNTVDLSERSLAEIYLPPFQAAVEAGSASLMCAFNEINGIPCSGNPMLLTDILRRRWGFTGMVVSDWNSIGELVDHGFAADRPSAGLLALQAGVDMDMQSLIYSQHLEELVVQGKLPESDLDQAVGRVLRTKFRLGLFDHPLAYGDPQKEKTLLLCREHRNLARQEACQSMVLLKNDGPVLPLPTTVSRLAVIGPLADNSWDILGSWACAGDPALSVSLLQGIKAKLPSTVPILHQRGCPIDSIDRRGFEAALQAARESDVIVMALGESAAMSGEAACRSDLGLPGVQLELLQAIHALGKPLVVLLMNGRPLSVPWIHHHCPAILECWFAGSEAGNAIADILFGDYNPSGKLPVTFPYSVGQIPCYYNHKNTGRPPSDTNHFTSKYLDLPLTPLYPFGYGLSYSRFEYSEFTLSADRITPSDSLILDVTLANTGQYPGVETVQLYLQDVAATVTRPVRELKDFKRVALEAGEKKQVRFILTHDQLMFYGPSMQKLSQPGLFRVYIGGNSRDCLVDSLELTD
ncbi:MAG: beta-glucosidase BglX [Candidatus Delongbacteria bacterium]|nr:beta-glucosidase BglX [Candidatus Delongbacteria bacterium]